MLATILISEFGNITLLSGFLYMLWNWNSLYITAMIGDDMLFDSTDPDSESDMDVVEDIKLKEIKWEMDILPTVMEMEMDIETKTETLTENPIINSTSSIVNTENRQILSDNLEKCILTLEKVYHKLRPDKIITEEPKVLMDIDDFEMIE